MTPMTPMTPIDASRAGMVEKVDRSGMAHKVDRSGMAHKLHRADAKPSPSAPGDPRLREAARQFEAVFLRVMLTSLQRTTKVGNGSPVSAGQSTYGSMVVDALSDALSASGGIGLQESLLDSLRGAGTKT